MTLEREHRTHMLSYVMFHLNFLALVRQSRTRVEMSSTPAMPHAGRKTTKWQNVSFYPPPPPSVIWDVRGVKVFIKVVLTTFMTPCKNAILHWVWFGPKSLKTPPLTIAFCWLLGGVEYNNKKKLNFLHAGDSGKIFFNKIFCVTLIRFEAIGTKDLMRKMSLRCLPRVYMSAANP